MVIRDGMTYRTKVFLHTDDLFKGQEPATFQKGHVINGWTLEFPLMSSKGWMCSRVVSVSDDGPAESRTADAPVMAQIFVGALGYDCLKDLINAVENALIQHDITCEDQGIENAPGLSSAALIAETMRMLKGDGYHVSVKEQLVLFKDTGAEAN